MRHVAMTVRAAGVHPDDAYARISDFGRYPELTETVLGVDLEPAGADGSVVSTWLVRFRKGQLRWTERDVLYPKARRIEFTQLRGDFAIFEGSWQVDAAPPAPQGTAVKGTAGDAVGAEICFRASFDLGIPSLAEILDPVADSTLRANIRLILTGLLGPVTDADPTSSGPAAPTSNSTRVRPGFRRRCRRTWMRLMMSCSRQNW